MADNNATQPEPLPTFESIQASPQISTRSIAAGRLHWSLSGSLSSSIFIMPNGYTPDPATLVPYTTQELTLDPLAQELMTRPAVRSIKVNVESLSDWEDDWVDEHLEHCGPPTNQRQTVIISDGEEEDLFDDDNNPIKIIMCCGERRPAASEPLPVLASDETRGVTINDYVQAVHPWLMARTTEILKSVRMFEQVPEGTVLMVNVNGPANLMIQTKARWVEQCARNLR